jgi:hypothetical protein
VAVGQLRIGEAYVDRTNCITAALYDRGNGHTHPVDGRARDCPHASRHLSEHQHSRGEHHLDLQRHGARGYRCQNPRCHTTGLTTTVDNIEHIESQSLYGIGVVKVFLQPTANVEQGVAEITAVSQTQLKQLPAGTTPPLIITYSASTVPILQLALSGQGLSQSQLNDYGLNFVRTE